MQCARQQAFVQSTTLFIRGAKQRSASWSRAAPACTTTGGREGRRGAWDVRDAERRAGSSGRGNFEENRYRGRRRDAQEDFGQRREVRFDERRRRHEEVDGWEGNFTEGRVGRGADRVHGGYAERRGGWGRSVREEYGGERRGGGYEGDEGYRYARERAERRAAEGPSLVQLALAAEEDDLVYGIAPVLMALESGLRERFEMLYVQERRAEGGVGPGRKAGNEMAVEKVLKLAMARDVEVVKLGKGELNVLSGMRPHQGVVLRAGKREYEELGVMKKAVGSECWLVLDEVSDPQNVGALLRSAHFLGADGVVVCRRNSAALSPVVSKASAGALEVMTVWGVASMPRFLRKARGEGWRVIGMGVEEGAVDAKGVVLEGGTLVVLGSEGKGLRKLVKEECDVVVKIRGNGGDSQVDSLNVSVAGAVALYQLLGR